jgi:hypothetical protein
MADAKDAPAADEHPPDATPVARLLRRDGAIALAALSLWAAADAWQATSGLALAALLAVADGLAVGAGLGALAHEWGHFAGARLAGGIAPTRPYRSFLPLFDLDLVRSSEAAFRSMSIGGNVGHWLVFVLLAAALPFDSASRVALVAGSFGYAVFASTTEVPVIRRSYAGASPIESFQGLSGDLLRRNGWIGAGAAAVFLVLF